MLDKVANGESNLRKGFESVRRRNAESAAVPEGFEKRLDFVIVAQVDELRQLCSLASAGAGTNAGIGLELSPFIQYFESRVQSGKYNISCEDFPLTRTVGSCLQTVDVPQFIRLLIDWIVTLALEQSTNPKTLAAELPRNQKGDIYFYRPLEPPK